VEISLTPIGHVRSSRIEVRDDDWDRETSVIVLDEVQFGPEALLGLEDFSHVEVVYFFHRVEESKIEQSARHPRGTRTGRWSGSSVSAGRTARTDSA